MERASPYQGLLSYDEEDAPFFFGRERETRLVIANLFASPLTLLYGPSGVGKTSLLQAGVIQTLHGRGDVTAVLFKAWQDDPLEALKATIAEHADVNGPSAAGMTLARLAEMAVARKKRPLMVLIDQFEERFAYRRDSAFEEALADGVNGVQVPASFLISIREDALSRLDVFENLIPSLFDTYLRVEHLDRASARMAICEPLDEYNARYRTSISIEDALVDEILDELATGRITFGETLGGLAQGPEPAGRIETPLLQLIMTRLWDEESLAGSDQLRLETFSRLGRAQRIVRTHLDQAMSELTPRERSLAAEAFRHLVTRSGTKIALSVSDLSEFDLPSDELQAVVEKLAAPEIRILRRVEASGENTEERFEIFHDVLAAAVLDWRARLLAGRGRGRRVHIKIARPEHWVAQTHFERLILRALTRGSLVPVLGFGVALSNRPDGRIWSPGSPYPPSSAELADYLHADFGLPSDIPVDLRQVAQFITTVKRSRPELTDVLHDIYALEPDPAPAHRLFAALPEMLRQAGGDPALLIVTTTFDRMLERAFHERNESFDVVTYLTEGDQAGRFSWRSPDGSLSMLDDPDGQGYELLASHPVILRLSGGVDDDVSLNSFVITEDDVINYLTRGSLAARLPSVLLETLGESRFLFLGLSQRDWTQRALVGSLLVHADLRSQSSWAVLGFRDGVEERFWERLGVEVADATLEELVAALAHDIGL